MKISNQKNDKKEMALYRKYRPSKWSDVVGQESVVKVLEGAVKLGNVSHAYLFAGPRGTGKTSIARILSSDLGVSGNDICEIDAASNRGIDNVRELREGVSASPFESPYKVYIIDEVHMLTKEAFNALLKTLEEPPSHVIFMLATTEPESLPETVVSRCQVFKLKKPSKKVICSVVERVSAEEGFKLEKGVSDLISIFGEGSFRDALGTLQKLLSYSEDKKISLKEAETVLGAPNLETVDNFVKALSQKNKEGALKILDDVEENNFESKFFLELVLDKIRMVLILRNASNLEGLVREKVSEEEFYFLSEMAKNKDSVINSNLLSEFLNAYSQLGFSQRRILLLELVILKNL